ncbi:hypothetical protein [Massilia sp. GCM10023247]|uniref:hypothetical protein n=1 Tax=Massilia sp. GCM10023247 TaxID=3252643 RepID=UPI00361AB319
MFNFFRKKTELEQLIASDGIEHAASRFADIISRKLPNKEIAYQFILQELDGARQGNEASKWFANNSGIQLSEYRNALSKSVPEVDGAGGPQQVLLALSLQLANDQSVMAKFRCKVADNIMKKFELGKYASSEERIANLAGAMKMNEAKPALQIEKKFEQIVAEMLAALNQDGIVMLDEEGAANIARESLQNISEQDLLKCKTNVACIYVLTQLAISAYEDGETVPAKYISKRCKPIGSQIMKLSQDNYNDTEFSMFDHAMEVMKKIDGHS